MIRAKYYLLDGAWFAADAVEYMNCSVLSLLAFIFIVRTSKTSLNVILVAARRLCSNMATLEWCSSICLASAPWAFAECEGRCLTYACSAAICLLIFAISCLMI